MPATRPRRTGSLTTTARTASLAGVERARVGDAVLDDHRGVAVPQSHAMALNCGDVHDRDACEPGVGAARVRAAHGVPGRGVVLEVDGGHVAPARRPVHRSQQVHLVRALQHHDVERLVRQLLGRRPPGRRRASPTSAPGRGRRVRGRAARAAT